MLEVFALIGIVSVSWTATKYFMTALEDPKPVKHNVKAEVERFMKRGA